MMGGACTNDADLAIVMSKDVGSIAGACAQMNFGNDAATQQCIKDQTGLSDPCIVCFMDTIKCVIANCLTECLSDPNSAACVSCRAAKCDPAFAMCSGLTPPPPDAGP